MNKIILTITFLFLFTHYSQAQNSRVIRIDFAKTILKKLDSSKSVNFHDKIANLNSLIAKNSDDLSYELVISDYQSVFKENKILVPDNLNQTFRKLAGSLGGTKGSFYINKKDSVFINNKVFRDVQYNVKIIVKKWLITKETKLICGYTCYRAYRLEETTNSSNIKNIEEVWFTTDLPSFFGPAGYFGLPGTVLEVNNGIINLIATKLKFEKKKNSFFEPFPKGILITQDEYNKLINLAAKNRYGVSTKY